MPGVGLYYGLLDVFQTNFSVQNDKPNNPTQAFCFGLTARSIVSLILLPITVVKVRYESGRFEYSSLAVALREAYLKNGWIGVTPTILRDSLFSGTYYMCYTELKSNADIMSKCREKAHLRNFVCGIASGLIASIITNPIDVLKTNIQVGEDISIRKAAEAKFRERGGLVHFFDGLVPRSIRRTLIAATTWTFYEFITDTVRH